MGKELHPMRPVLLKGEVSSGCQARFLISVSAGAGRVARKGAWGRKMEVQGRESPH